MLTRSSATTEGPHVDRTMRHIKKFVLPFTRCGS